MNNASKLILAVFLSVLGNAVMQDVQAASVEIANRFGTFSVEAKSTKEMRWDTVVRQQYDYSCGSAAVATLLTYHYGRRTTEAEVFKAMIENGDRRKIQAQGFSMLDMKRYLDSKGLDTDGFRVDLEHFLDIRIPAITLIDTQGYKHFVVIKGMDEDKVLVGDPAVGTVVVPKAHFKRLWSGIVLGARADVELARQHFNSKKDWRIRPSSPLEQGINRTSVGPASLLLPAATERAK